MKTKKRSNQVAITLPTDIIKMADKDAEREIRKRSNILAKIIIEHYEKRGVPNDNK